MRALLVAAVLAVPAVAAAEALPFGGSFRLRDAATRAEIPLTPASATALAWSGGGIGLTAEVSSENGYVLVRGRVDGRGDEDRGVIVDYLLPATSRQAWFANDLDQKRPLSESAGLEGNVFPIAVLGDADRGLAAALPPTEPRVFGMAADPIGLVVRFYLGLSPATRRFPNAASFAFLLYPTDPRWGFRGALAGYYRRFPEFYTPRLKHEGLWMFQMRDRVPPNVDQYGFDEIEPSDDPAVLSRAIARDRAHGIDIFAYTIVGEREIKFLPELPKNYEGAVQELRRWTPKRVNAGAVTKEDVSVDAALHLKEEIESSACETREGRYAIVIRQTPWGGNSVTFKINPNPDLFAGEGRRNVGADTIALAQSWLAAHPEYAGIYVDSLGANWPAALNYRRDHFASASLPLTVDPSGRPALHNDLSHYEFLWALRARLRAAGKLLFGNGIYAYKSRGELAKPALLQTFDNQLNEFNAGGAPPEHYRPGARVGRFFDAALLDVGGSEAGVNATIERCREARALMGPKTYAFLNYRWENPAQVSEFLNLSLAYGIFATSSRNFMTGVEYETNPNGYFRDKALIDWFVPLARTLSAAGWEPVTEAEASVRDLVCERFGAGRAIYFALYNDRAAPRACTLRIDLPSLGFPSGGVALTEIARGIPLDVHGEQVALTLPAKSTAVIALAPAARN